MRRSDKDEKERTLQCIELPQDQVERSVDGEDYEEGVIAAEVLRTLKKSQRVLGRREEKLLVFEVPRQQLSEISLLVHF